MSPQYFTTILENIVNRVDLQPKNGETFCNIFLQEISHLFCFNGFDDLMANQIIDVMKTSGKFKVYSKNIDYYAIAKAAAKDPLTMFIAGQKEQEHGHVCVILPIAQVTYSGKWGKHVVNVANVGKTNFYNKGLNWAFATEPEVFQLI
jgi:hypothetical protein